MPESPQDLTVDHLFLLYRTSGRPGHLARVFDRTAPELLRLAAHLARDPGQAEDLVQSTFLEAMRGAPRFQSGRRVLPWLVGILTNVARDARRKERALPQGVGEREGPADPASVAEATELSEAVDEELERLDEPYRAVLILYLRHGMNPGEIARVVGCSPATVRSQLARGRARLQERLGGARVQGVLVGWSAGRGLESLRTSVVRDSLRMAPRIWLASTLAGLASVPTVAVLSVVACLAWVASRPGANDVRPNKPETLSLRGEVSRSQEAADTLRSSPGPGEEGRRVVERSAANSLVQVEVLVHHGGLAVAGVGVRLRPDVGSDGVFTERHARTNETGFAVFDDVVPGSVRVDLDRARGFMVDIAAGSPRRVPMELGGRRVAGVVRDDSGVPVPFASVWLAYRGRTDLGMVAGTSDGQGRFELEGVADGYFLTAFAPGQRPGRLQPADGEAELEVVLGGPATVLSGRVVDHEGNPVPDAMLRVGHEAPPFEVYEALGGRPRTIGNEAVLEVRTDRAGKYRFEHAPPGRVEVFARARGRVGDHAILSLSADGEAQHDVVLHPGRMVRGRMHEGGTPAEGCWVSAEEPWSGAPLWFRPAVRSDREGLYVLEGVSSDSVLSVLDRRGRTVTGHAQGGRWDVDFSSIDALTGRVLGPGGRPVPGLLVTPGEGLPRESRTDAEGRFRLLVPGAREVLVIDDRGAVPIVVARIGAPDQIEGEQVLHVDGTPGARGTLVGRLEAVEGGALHGQGVRVRQVGGLLWQEFPVDPGEGRFQIDSMVPTEYEIIAFADDRVPLVLPAISLDEGVRDLGGLRLAPAGTLTWRVNAEGRDHRGWIHLNARDEQGVCVAERELLEVGEAVRGLPAGTLEVTLWGWDLPIVTRTVHVIAGGTTHLDVELTGPREQVFLVRRPPEHVPDEDLSLRLSWCKDGVVIATDDHHFPRASHRFSFQRPLLPGRYELRARTGKGQGCDLEFEVTTGRARPIELLLRDLQER